MIHLSIGVSSYNVNLMLASIISLLLLLLFVLLLHVYAKCLLLRARHLRITRLPSSLCGFHPSSFSLPTKGLDPSLITSIPIFLYKSDPAVFLPDGDGRIMRDFGLECVICLNHFEEDEFGRALTKCGHAFHMECIDMWLHSHTTCPICRAPAVSAPDISQEANKREAASGESAINEMGGWEAVIDVLEGDNGSSMVSGEEEEEEEEEEGEVVSMVMDVFIVSVSVSRAGSTRRIDDSEEAA